MKKQYDMFSAVKFLQFLIIKILERDLDPALKPMGFTTLLHTVFLKLMVWLCNYYFVYLSNRKFSDILLLFEINTKI
jgi:hypothetical protein